MKIDQLAALITAAAGDELPIWDADEANPQQRTKKITVQDIINSAVTIADLLKQTDIYNGLDQTAAGYALDARQGKALNDLATKNVLGAAVSLNSYTSSPYTFPSDGFLSCSCASASAAKALCQVYGSDDSQLFRLGGWGNGTYGTWTCFVRKGMKAQVSTVESNGAITFLPLS